jgi:hypothetical protein
MATTALVVAMAPAALGALAGTSPTSHKGHATVVFSQGGLDSNPVNGNTFMARFDKPRAKRQAGDNCSILEKRQLRSFRASPFGPPRNGRMRIFLMDRRRPSLSVVRWSVDPNQSQGEKPETLRVQGLTASKSKGKTNYWQAKVSLPPDESSYVVVRVAWRDPGGCATGPDRLASGISFVPRAGS